MVCSELGLIGGDMFAVDGCKLPSNASKEWSGTFKDLRSKKDKLQKLLETMLSEHEKLDRDGGTTPESKEKAEKIEEFLKTGIRQHPGMQGHGQIYSAWKEQG